MRIVVRFARKDSRTKAVMNEFKNAVALLKNELMFLDRLELWVCDENKAVLDGRCAKILVNISNPFFHDARMARSFLMQSIFRILAVRKGISGQDTNLAANRDMVKGGYGDELVYYFYTLLTNSKPADADMAWQSFYGIDDYNCRFFIELMSKLGYGDFNADNKI